MVFFSRLFCFFCLVGSSTLHGFVSVQANQWQLPRGGTDVPPTATARQASWSSYATVDPSSILSLLVKKAGFFLDPKLRTLADLLHCQQAKLNVANRELLIHNFTVSLPGEPHSLRIGRIHLAWHSYRRPCLEVELEDVDVMVEFTNLLFTRNNWNDLNDRGFPPEITYYDESTTNASVSESEFVRLGSLDFQGRVVLHMRSRPLQKAITEDIVLSLQTLRDLKYKVKVLAEANERKIGRRGLTSDELYAVLKSFFNEKIKQAARYAIEDLATSQLNPRQSSQLVNNSKQLLASAKAAVLGYAADVELLSADTIKDRLKNLKGQDDDTLFKDEDVDEMVSGSLDAIKGAIRTAGVSVFNTIVQLQRASSNTTNLNTTFDDDGPIFADW